ncbi:MAG: hypothetical protein RLO80_03850 [Hyphomonas sp.]
MPREVDERKKRAALRKLRRAADLASRGLGPPLTDWEVAFLEEVEARVEKYGSAFADPMKGAEGEALSGLQQLKLKQIDKKARGKEPKGFQTRKPMGMKRRPPVRASEPETESEVPPPEPSTPARTRPALVPASGPAGNVTSLRRARPQFTVIEGGAKKTEN